MPTPRVVHTVRAIAAHVHDVTEGNDQLRTIRKWVRKCLSMKIDSAYAS